MQETPLKSLTDFSALVSFIPAVFCTCPVLVSGALSTFWGKQFLLHRLVDLVLGHQAHALQGQSIGFVLQNRLAFVGLMKEKGIFKTELDLLGSFKHRGELSENRQ